uniref:V-set and transmembrane domain containing 2 like n=1 Tax=Xiphophorus couchianus TaxID=32473 RepID=A0A3B5MVS8_9TELE
EDQDKHPLWIFFLTAAYCCFHSKLPLGVTLFTEVPHDVTAQIGEDVEMACSFHGAGSPSFSLEIQWWYIRNHKDSQGLASQISNTEMPKDATKISVVKVAGSNISHKLRLSGVKPADEGTYECHVIDHSGPVEQRYRVQAYLRVEPDRLQENYMEKCSRFSFAASS